MVNARVEIELFLMQAIKALMRRHPAVEVRQMCARLLDEWEMDADLIESQMLPRLHRDELPPWTE